MKEINEEEILIKIIWNKIDDAWGSTLLTIRKNKGFVRRPLHPDNSIRFSFTGKRRCIGYISDNGRIPCSNFKLLDSGRQCYRCRQKDVHLDYIEGRSGKDRSGQHSVYMAIAGGNVKVGITRSGRIMRRWIEQGASYASIIKKCENAQEALDIESQISKDGVSERIMKVSKYNHLENEKQRLEESIKEAGYESNIIDVQERSMYSIPKRISEYVKDGKIYGEITGVKGQIIYVDDVAVGITKGKCINKSDQKSISRYS